MNRRFFTGFLKSGCVTKSKPFVWMGVGITAAGTLAGILSFALDRRKPPFFESVVRLHFSETAVGFLETSLDAEIRYLLSPEFHDFVAREASVKQLEQARSQGASPVWPGLDESPESARDSVRPYRIRKDEKKKILELVFRASSEEQVVLLAHLVPELFVNAKRAAVRKRFSLVRRFLGEKLADLRNREKELIRKIWVLRGSLTARHTAGPSAALSGELLSGASTVHRAPPGEKTGNSTKTVPFIHPRPSSRSPAAGPLAKCEQQAAEALELEEAIGDLELRERMLRDEMEASLQPKTNLAGFSERLNRLERDLFDLRKRHGELRKRFSRLELAIRENPGSLDAGVSFEIRTHQPMRVTLSRRPHGSGTGEDPSGMRGGRGIRAGRCPCRV